MMIPINPLEIAKKAFPILTWAKEYDTGIAISDLVAGITVALTLIPQSIAYASLAGLEPQVLFIQNDKISIVSKTIHFTICFYL